jgi:5-methylcytosine-specific restriction endonuclease McrA
MQNILIKLPNPIRLKSPSKIYAPKNSCIYCGVSDGKLSDEHIIPLSLGGNMILPKASWNSIGDRPGQTTV